jgi:hypothetical protein
MTSKNKMCTSKIKYTLQEARETADRLQLRIYNCPFCKGYHLTSQRKKQFNKRFKKLEGK